MEYLPYATDIQQDRSRQHSSNIFAAWRWMIRFHFFGVAIISGLCDEVDRSYVEVETCSFFTFLYLAPTPYYCLFLISLAPNMSKIWLVHMAFQLFPCRNSCLTSQIKPMPMCLKEQLPHLQSGSCFQFFFKMMQLWMQYKNLTYEVS